MGGEGVKSRGRSRSRSKSRNRSKSKPKLRRADADAERDGKKEGRRSKIKRGGKGKRRKSPGPSLQAYLDEAITAATASALSMFERVDDDDSGISDEFSFLTESSHSNPGQGEEKYSASDQSVEVAAVTTKEEEKSVQQQQPDIATFRLKRHGRPYAVRKLVKQLQKEELKRQKAALALEKAEENMWKTKWQLYNLAERFDLLCGTSNANEAAGKEVEQQEDGEEDSIFGTDSFFSFGSRDDR